MIVVFKHEAIGQKHLGEFYDSFEMFVRSKFAILIDAKGYITVNGELTNISYLLGVGENKYTKPKALQDFCGSSWIKSYVKSRFYTAYTLTKIV